MTQSITISQRAQKRIQSGNLWVYKSDITNFESHSNVAGGEIVNVTDERGRFVARAYFNPLSLISLRVMTRDEREEIGESTIKNRLLTALNRRRASFDLEKTSIVRLLYSEADRLPGLVADMYGRSVVIQALSAGAEKFLEYAVDFYRRELAPECIFIKNDADIRRKEGLPLYTKFVGRELKGPQKIVSDGIAYLIDLASGQKTGFFADQRRAYEELSGNVSGKNILDCFCYSGAFSMNAFKYGAARSTLVDISDEAIELAKETAKLNGVYEKCEFVRENAFDYLNARAKLARSGKYRADQYYDFIILDPPAFAKNKASLPGALAGYKDLALRAVTLTKKTSFILTCSCSFHVGLQDFYDSQCEAFADAGVEAYTLKSGFQDVRDHPVKTSMPETLYLKYFMFRIEK